MAFESRPVPQHGPPAPKPTAHILEPPSLDLDLLGEALDEISRCLWVHRLYFDGDKPRAYHLEWYTLGRSLAEGRRVRELRDDAFVHRVIVELKNAGYAVEISKPGDPLVLKINKQVY